MISVGKTTGLSVWFLLLLLICFGLGYPTLNRYDPTTISGLSDSLQYYRMIEFGPQMASGHWKYRVLVPLLAKPIYWASRGRFASWNPIALALLVVNSVFCAASAFLVSVLAHQFTRNPSAAVAAAFAYLLNFTVPNYHLSAMIDSADAFFFVLLTWALVRNRWLLLPAVGLFAALSKETFVPLSAVFVLTWLLKEPTTMRLRRALILAAMVVVGLATVSVLHSVMDHSWVFPWSLASHEHGAGGVGNSLLRIFAGWNFWVTMIWLPFVFLAARRIPSEWRWAALAGGLVVVALFVWNDAGPDTARPLLSAGNVERPIFDVAGGLFAVSFACVVGRFQAATDSALVSKQD